VVDGKLPHLIELQQGEIGVVSPESGGTVVTIGLPEAGDD